MQKGDSAVAPPCLLHVIDVELRDSLLLFPHLCTICSLAPMSCYFSELSALLACLFKGTKYGLDRRHADLDWLAGKLVWHLAGWAVGKPTDGLVYVASLLLRKLEQPIGD